MARGQPELSVSAEVWLASVERVQSGSFARWKGRAAHRLDLAQFEVPAAALGINIPVGFPGILSAEALVLDTIEALAKFVAVSNEIIVIQHGGRVRVGELQGISFRKACVHHEI